MVGVSILLAMSSFVNFSIFGSQFSLRPLSIAMLIK